MDSTVFGCVLGALLATSLPRLFIDVSAVKSAEEDVIKSLNFYTLGLGRMLIPMGRKIWYARNVLLGVAILLALFLAANAPYKG